MGVNDGVTDKIKLGAAGWTALLGKRPLSHGSQLGGSTIISNRPLFPGRPAPSPALNGVRLKLPNETSATETHERAPVYELPPPETNLPELDSSTAPLHQPPPPTPNLQEYGCPPNHEHCGAL